MNDLGKKPGGPVVAHFGIMEFGDLDGYEGGLEVIYVPARIDAVFSALQYC
jgi:hypothetical protein